MLNLLKKECLGKEADFQPKGFSISMMHLTETKAIKQTMSITYKNSERTIKTMLDKTNKTYKLMEKYYGVSYNQDGNDTLWEEIKAFSSLINKTLTLMSTAFSIFMQSINLAFRQEKEIVLLYIQEVNKKIKKGELPKDFWGKRVKPYGFPEEYDEEIEDEFDDDEWFEED